MRPAQANRRPPLFASSLPAFEEEFDYLYRALRRHGVNAADSEDLVQDVFLIMLRRWSDYEPDRPLRPWLAGIAFHVAQAHLRRAWREVPDATLLESRDGPASPDVLGAVHARLLVLRALARLPDRHRAALVLHDLDGLRMPEVASTLRIPMATAYTRVRRARLAFAQAVAEVQAGAQSRLDAEALLSIERAPLPAPRAVRQRAMRRARALHMSPLAPAIHSAPRWLKLAVGPVLVAAALLTVGARGRHRQPAVVASSPALAVARSWPSGRAPVTATLATGLIGYWSFDERVGGRAVDHSGAGHDCAMFGRAPARAWIDGWRGGGLAADGTAWLVCPDPARAGVAEPLASAAAWIRRKGPQPYHGALVAQQLDGRRDQGILFAVVGDELVLHSPVWSEAALVAPLPAPREGWVHVAFTHGRDGTRLYVGGREVAAAPPGRVGRWAPPMRAPLVVGATKWGTRLDQPRQLFHGAIDELVFYDRALTGDEVAALAGGARPSSDGMTD